MKLQADLDFKHLFTFFDCILLDVNALMNFEQKISVCCCVCVLSFAFIIERILEIIPHAPADRARQNALE